MKSTTDRAFLDTNVLVYTLARNNVRHEKALRLLGVGGIVSVQVLNEFVSVLRRKIRLPWEEVHAALSWIRALCPNPIPLSLGTHNKAIEIAERYGYQIYDALVIASALEAESDVLYSEDLRHGQVIDRKLAIRNPFL